MKRTKMSAFLPNETKVNVFCDMRKRTFHRNMVNLQTKKKKPKQKTHFNDLQ